MYLVILKTGPKIVHGDEEQMLHEYGGVALHIFNLESEDGGNVMLDQWSLDHWEEIANEYLG